MGLKKFFADVPQFRGAYSNDFHPCRNDGIGADLALFLDTLPQRSLALYLLPFSGMLSSASIYLFSKPWTNPLCLAALARDFTGVGIAFADHFLCHWQLLGGATSRSGFFSNGDRTHGQFGSGGAGANFLRN